MTPVTYRNGRPLLAATLPTHAMRNGQLWAPADGEDRVVRLNAERDGWICYTWKEGGRVKYHEMVATVFQERFRLVLNGPEVPDGLLDPVTAHYVDKTRPGQPPPVSR